MMKPTLTIIIPCYNCQETLKEAVDSCFVQGLDNFEIVMVDDGSTDQTKNVMQSLADTHTEIKLFYHEKNKGGGATRNTAVRNAQADVIFCLDSDDMLPENTLSKMLDYLKEKKCDGVGIHKSIKFNGTNINNIEVVHVFGYAGSRVPFESLVEKKGVDMNPLYSTFMHTRRAFDITVGYPENHGFDTQSFAWSFLSNGLVAYTCPETSYLHRINFHKSYYIREAEGGRVNLNWFKIFDEFLFLFSDKAKIKILKFKFNDYTKNICDAIKKVDPLFIKNVEEYTKPHIKDNRIKEINLKTDGEKTIFDLYWLGSELFRKKDFVNAQKALLAAKNKGFAYPIIYDKLLLCEKFFLGENIDEEIKKMDLSKQKKIPMWKYYLKFLKQKMRTLIGLLKSLWSHIEARKGNKRFFSLFVYFLQYRILKKFKFNFTVKKFDPMSIDILIVTTSKDYLLLETYLESLKNNLCQNINKIFLVSFPRDEILNFCKLHNINFVDERQVLGYGKDSITYKVNGVDRSGWMLQQLIKLYGDTIVEKENFLSVCSDTILINKNSFFEDGKFVFFENEEWHEPYFKNFKKIFGYDTKNKMSFTSHMMIFNAKKMKLLREELKQKNKMSWDKAYMSTISDTEVSCISDYDTYANWVLYNFPQETVIKPLYNTALKRSQLPDFEKMLPDLKNKYNTVSFHSYVKE